MSYDFKILLPHCKTDKQTKYIEACIEHGSIRSAAKRLNVSRECVRASVKSVRKYAGVVAGYSPESGLNHPVAKTDLAVLDSFSDMRTNEEGKPIWYKYSMDKSKQIEAMKEVIEHLKDDLPIYEPPENETVESKNDDLLNCYIISDYHIGLLAFESVTGDEDWDTRKAEDLLYKWFDLAIKSSPPAANALFLELGDFMHIDNQNGVTSRSGNVLPHDFPMNKLMKVAVRAYNVVVHKLAEKYDNVKVIIVDGNHDDNGAKWASSWLSYMYQNFNNIDIDNTEDSYYCHKFGDVSIFAHHGHIKKIGEIQETLVSKFRDVFGSTSKSYCHLGHYHHIQSKETSLMVLEQHRTLSAKDNHASQGGYSSGRSSTVVTYHKKYGEIARATISRDCIV